MFDQEVLKKQGVELLQQIAAFIDITRIAGYTNEQWFIDWEDALNKYSVMDHNNQ